jgi:hypothetical protein
MAPMAPLGRVKAMALVKEGKFPIWFGTPHPFMAIVEQDGKFRIRELLIDDAEAKAASEHALATTGMWMPEHHYALGKPVGKIFAEADSSKDLLTQMETMTWPKDW